MSVVLSAGVRQNLLSLQNTAALTGQTQNRLATGKKVNSALDNPSNFFTSQSLSNRARDLNSLLDSIGQAQKTLEAADKGLSSLTKLVESAKSIAKQARQAPAPSSTTYGAVSVSNTIAAETLASHDGAAVTVANATLYTFDIAINGGAARTVNFTSSGAATYAEILAGLQADLATELTTAGYTGRVTLTTGGGGNDLKLDAVDADIDFTISAASVNTGLTNAAYASTSLFDTIGGANGQTLDIAVNGGATTQITFGTATGQVSTRAEFSAAVANISGLTHSFGATTSTFSVAAGSTQTSLTLTGSTAGVRTALGFTNGMTQGALTVVTGSNAQRTSLQSDYNAVLTQIDQLAQDAGYNGINLLNGGSLKVVFNEGGTSSLTITGVTYGSTGLGLSQVTGTNFQSDSFIDTTIASLDGALNSLRTQASKFGSNLTTVQTRQDFTKNLVATLTTGADSLVLADTNEEGANLLALQTRQQLSVTALSLSSQADQAVLRLF